jgi:hypothetical protein
MAIQKTTGGVFADITTLKRRASGAWVDMLFSNRAKRREAGAWVDLLSGAASGDLAVSLDDGTVSVIYECDDPTTPPYVCPTLKSVTTATVTATATGGSGAGPTYSWAYVSGDAGFTCNSPTAAATTWTITLPQNVLKTAVWRITVVRGVETVTADVTVTARYTRTGGIEA